MTNGVHADFVIMGLGNPQAEFLVTRLNAGYIFADYLANCISMQNVLLSQQTTEEDVANNVIPDGFKRPTFVRNPVINDSSFSLTEADLYKGPASAMPPNADTTVKVFYHLHEKTLRIVIVKSLTDISESGLVLKKVIELYNIKDVGKQVIVAYHDCNTLPDGSDVRGTEGNKGAQSIISEIGNNFVRFRLGVGRSEGIPDDSYALESFPEANQEMDMFGYALDITGQALQHYLAFGDVKATKKKFGTSRKLPKVLRKLPGLLFPIQVCNDSDVKPEAAVKAAKNTVRATAKATGKQAEHS